MFSKNKGIAIGTYVMEFDGKAWKLIPKKSDLENVFGVFAKDENHIYLTKRIDALYSSELLFFDGRRWNKIYDPFSNAIFSIHVTSKNNIWLGGDREISFRKNNKWTNIPYPPGLFPTTQIYGGDETQVWVRYDNKLFFYDKNKWIRELKDENVVSFDFENANRGYTLVDNKILELSDGKWNVYSTDEALKYIQKIYYQKPNKIWGLGKKGFLVLFDGIRWHQLDFPVKESLTSISFLSDNEGWIGGDKGTLVRFSSKMTNTEKMQRVGFEATRPFPYGKNIDDEYGVAIDDINGDGFRDIYSVCLYDPNRLYINYIEANKTKGGDIPFKDEAAKRNASGVSEFVDYFIPKLHLGVGLADIENDGDLDIYICSLNETNKLLINDGGGFFRDISSQSGRTTDQKERTNSAIFGDVNNDGSLDLFITNE